MLLPPDPTEFCASLFSPTERAERRFWEFFTARIRNPNSVSLDATQRVTQLPERQDIKITYRIRTKGTEGPPL